MGTASVRPPNLPSLTGLRYLAAALVVLHHTAPVLMSGTFAERLTAPGYVGVSFFFVLSGFVLTWSLDAQSSKASFYRKRFARVYPMHFLTTVAAATVNVLSDADKSWIAVVAALLLLHAWVPSESFYFGAANGPSWSLSVEAFFYLLFPFVVGPVVRLVRVAGWWSVPAAALAVELAYGTSSAYSHWFAYISPAYRLLEFVTGIALGSAVRSGVRTTVPLAGGVALMAATFLAVAVLLPGVRHGMADALMLPSICLTLVAAASADLGGRATLWSRPALVRWGEWSFALYLTHYSMIRLLARMLDEPRLHPLAGAALTLLFLVLATWVAAAAFVLVERPAERRLRGRRRAEELPERGPSRR